MKTISYIVPVYNAEKYLKQCIDSILKQKSNDIELILVDDGSSDKSPIILDEYRDKDERVIVIHQKNGGVSSARNSGLLRATGKYIRFVDSDDKICETNEIEIVYKSKADLIVAGAVVLDEAENVLREIKSSLNGEVNIYNILDKMDCELKKTTLHYVWNHFYKREIIERENLRFDSSLSLGEDFLFNVSYFEACGSIEYIHDNICCYYKRGNPGLTGVFKKDEFNRRKRMDEVFLFLYEKRGKLQEKRNEVNMMLGEIAYLSLLKIRHTIPKNSYRNKIAFLKQMFDSEYRGLIILYLSSDGCKGFAKRIERVLIKMKLKRMFYLFEKIKYNIQKNARKV